MDGRESEEAGQAGGGCAAVNPGQLKCRQREGQVFGAGDKAALVRLHEDRAESGAVERLQHFFLERGPLVGVALAGGDQAGNRGPRHAASALHQHLQVKAVGKTPLQLADGVRGERKHGTDAGKRSRSHKGFLQQRAYCA